MGSPEPATGLSGKLWFWLPWPVLVAADLWSKHYVFGFLDADYAAIPEPMRAHNVFQTDLLRFDLVQWRNTGTIWGLFQDGTVALMVLRCFAVVGLLWFVSRTARTAKLQLAVLSLIFAGALGNLYDNFFCLKRAVRDFLYFTGKWPMEWTFPAFNVADSCITVGAIVLFVLLWREDRRAAAGPDAAATQESQAPSE
ncbi:MAG: signal peptidase II [bacterium]|nr:signal peptidase II [bacterium]